jgi:hypothetical protein
MPNILQFRYPAAVDRYAALSQIAQGYVTALISEEPGEAAFDDLAVSSVALIIGDCAKFAAKANPVINFPSELLDDFGLGLAFYRTRSGGGGFIAMEMLGDAADRLQEIALGFPPQEIHRDDGQIYLR